MPMLLQGHSMSDLSGRLIAADHQVCEIVQRTEAELVGMTYEALTHPDDLPLNVSLIGKLRAGGGAIAIEKRYLRPDGSTVRARALVSRLGGAADGLLVGTITMLPAFGMGPGARARWDSAIRERTALHERRVIFGPDVFSDYFYLLLLELYLAEIEGRAENLEALSRSTHLLDLQATRWLGVMATRDLVEALGPAKDVFRITEYGIRAVEKLLHDR